MAQQEVETLWNLKVFQKKSLNRILSLQTEGFC